MLFPQMFIIEKGGMGGMKAMKYRVVLEVDVRENWCSIEDFTKSEIDGFNQANKPMIKVSVLEIKEKGK